MCQPLGDAFAGAPDRGAGAIMQKDSRGVKQYVVVFLRHYISGWAGGL